MTAAPAPALTAWSAEAAVPARSTITIATTAPAVLTAATARATRSAITRRCSRSQLLLGRCLDTFGEISLWIPRGGPRREVDVRHVALVEPDEA